MAKAAKKKASKKATKPANKPKIKVKPKLKGKPVSKSPGKVKADAKAKSTAKISKGKPSAAAKPLKNTSPQKKESASTPKASKKGQAETPSEKRVPLGPIEPGRLGQKRNCLECGTKFYDFERSPITCPKCFSEFEPEDFEPKIILKSDAKKARAQEKEEEPEREIVVSESSEFESLEDLSDDESAVVGIGPDKDSDESFD